MKSNDVRFRAILRESHFRAPVFENGKNLISNQIKDFLKKWPAVFNWLKKRIGPDHSPASGFSLASQIRKQFGLNLEHKVIVNIGSGTNRIHPEIINIDILPFKNVDIVADIVELPLANESVDGIICDTVLEHITNPDLAMRELSRILKPGGALITIVPFLYPYHSSPNDFHRWTSEGLRHMLERNEMRVTELGVLGGPMGALQSILMHVFAIILSFGSKTLYFIFTQMFMAILSPLKLLDIVLMRSPYAIEAASGMYAISKKNEH